MGEQKHFHKYYLLFKKYNVFERRYEKLKKGFDTMEELISYRDFIQELQGNRVKIMGVHVNEL